MLHIGYLIILDGQNTKKISFENSMFQLPRLENSISRLCPSPIGTPPPKKKHPNRVKNTQRGSKISFYIGYFIIVNGQT